MSTQKTKLEKMLLDLEYIRVSNKKLACDFAVLTQSFRGLAIANILAGILMFSVFIYAVFQYMQSLSIFSLVSLSFFIPTLMFCINHGEKCDQIRIGCQNDEVWAEQIIQKLKEILEVGGV